MKGISLVKHAPTSPGLRLLGFGPNFKPTNGVAKLQSFLNENTFWAKGRNKNQICKSDQRFFHRKRVIGLCRWFFNETRFSYGIFSDPGGFVS